MQVSLRLGGVVAVLITLGGIPSILAAQGPRPVISGSVVDSAGVPIGYTSVMMDGKVRVVARRTVRSGSRPSDRVGWWSTSAGLASSQ